MGVPIPVFHNKEAGELLDAMKSTRELSFAFTVSFCYVTLPNPYLQTVCNCNTH